MAGKSVVITPEQAREDRQRRAAEAASRRLTVCTKYQLVNALKTVNESLYDRLRELYANSPDIQFYWNTVQDLNRDNEDFKVFQQVAGVSDAELDSIFDVIKEQSGQ